MGQQGQKDGARFAVGFSYAGENRALVAPLAEELARRCGRERVLFDRFHEAELARPDLDVYLPRLYRDETELIVVLLSPDYPNKRWCGLEWRWIRQLIVTHAQERIMLLRAGDPGDLSELGILAGDGFLDVSSRAAADISALILERMVQRGIRIPEAAGPGLEQVLTARLRGAVKGGNSARRFYISCPYLGLQKEREEAKKLITRRNHSYGDSYGGSPDPLVETCERDVRASDHYILILGERYGTRRPEHGGMSVTELEFKAAVEAGLSLHAFYLGFVSDARNGIEHEAEAQAALTAFRRRVSAHCVPVDCSDQEDGRSGWEVFTEALTALAAKQPGRRKEQDLSGEGVSAWRIQLTLEEIRVKLSEFTPSNVNDQANEDEQVDSQIALRQGLTHTAEILTRTFDEIETRSLGTAVAGIPVNFYDLDALTQGLQRSDLIIVAGRPAMGKTSFVLNIAKNVAQFHNLPVAVFSLEMSKEQLTYRLLSMEVGIESGRLRTGRLHEEEWPLLGKGISSLGALPLHIYDKPNAGLLEMRSMCRGLMAETGKELGLVIIDYLQLMEGSTPDNREQEISRITRGLKGMARELNVLVIALSQLSRGVEARTNKRPMLSDLRESGSIEQDADLVLMIYRDEYYNPDTADRGITEVIVTKHRNGPVGTVKLLFEPQFTRFRNLAA
jgi:replicative DNA helicase